MNICQRCVMLHVPMALAFKELSNTGPGVATATPANSRLSEPTSGAPPCQTAARGSSRWRCRETARGKWELLTERSEVDKNNGHIFSLPTRATSHFPLRESGSTAAAVQGALG